MIIIITTFCNFSDKKTLHCSSYISSFLLKFQSLFKHPEPRPSDKNGVCWQSSWTRNEIKGWWPCRTMPTWSFPFWNRYSGIKGVTCYQPNSQRSPREGIIMIEFENSVLMIMIILKIHIKNTFDCFWKVVQCVYQCACTFLNV